MVATRTWGRIAAIGVAVVVVSALLSPGAQAVFVLAIAAIATATVQLMTCRQVSDPRPWRWFVLAGALFLGGNAILVDWKIATGGSAPLPSPADPFFLLGYGALLTGELLLVRRRSSDPNTHNMIDTLMVTTVVAVCLWAFLLAPVLLGAGLTTPQRLFEVIYASFDLAVIAGAVRLALGSGRQVPSYYFLAGALGCVLLADTVITLQKSGSAGSIPVAVISCATFVLFALAGLHPSADRLTDRAQPEDARLTARRVALLCGAFLVLPIGFVIDRSQAGRVSLPIVIVGSVVLGVLAVARMAGLVRAKERRTHRERLLRQAGQALVAATDRDQLCCVALVSLAALAQVAQRDACVSLATSDEENLLFAGWVGSDGNGTRSTSLPIRQLPLEAQQALTSGRCFVVDPGRTRRWRRRDGGRSRFTSLLMVPVEPEQSSRGVLAIMSPRPLGVELRQSIDILSAQVTLALQSAALTDEIHRSRSERRFRALVEQSSDLVLVVGTDGHISFVSPASGQVLGVSENELLGRPPLALVHPHDQAPAKALLDRTWANATATDRIEVRLRRGDGTFGWFELLAENLSQNDQIGGAVIHVRDITDRKRAELRLSESEARFRSLVQHGGDIVMVLDSSLRFSYVSPSAGRLLGYGSSKLTGTALSRLFHVDDLRDVAGLIERGISSRRDTPIELRLRHKSGRWVSIETTITDLRHDQAVRGIVLNGRSNADRKELERELRYKALHDALTGLANRTSFIERAANILDRRDLSRAVAVLFIDLDDFKNVNDGMGHMMGDALLIEMASRLRRSLRPADTAARLGGDEFAVLVEGISDAAKAQQVAERVIAALSDPVSLEGHEVRVGASIGVAVSRERGGGRSSAEELLRDADMAMYRAKITGKGRVQLFERRMRAETSERLALTNDIANALRRNELFVHYQPIVDLRSGRSVGAEALARWRHPTRGMIPPAQFIPVAEKSGTIMALGEFVLDRACTTLMAHQKHSQNSFRMSVNLSINQLEHPDLPIQVARAIRRHKVNPWDLVLEITESLSPVDVVSTCERLHELKRMGVRLAIDDFGTGYSSLAYLERFPVDELKIDRAFISALETNGKSDIVTSIINLASAKRLSTVAEGVERKKSARVLADLGCDLAQGFYFSTPVDPQDLPDSGQDLWGKARGDVAHV